MAHRCVHCGRCLRVCPQKAWKASGGENEEPIPATAHRTRLDPAVFWQFGNRVNPAAVIRAFEEIGFPGVGDMSRAYERYRLRIQAYFSSPERALPTISSTCPAVVEFIRVKYPSLIENLTPILSPAEGAGEEGEDSSIPEKPRGIYVSPCLARAEVLRISSGERGEGDRILPIERIFNRVKAALRRPPSLPLDAPVSGASRRAMIWAVPGGESEALGISPPFIAAGLERLGRVLDQVEAGLLDEVSYIEAWACPEGCLGGPFTVQDPGVAAFHLGAWIRAHEKDPIAPAVPTEKVPPRFRKRPPARPGLRLDENVKTAMEKLRRIDEIVKSLPGIDCGSCGSPTCLALAEDIVQGLARAADCLILFRRPPGQGENGSD
jgi:ferredoxin